MVMQYALIPGAVHPRLPTHSSIATTSTFKAMLTSMMNLWWDAICILVPVSSVVGPSALYACKRPCVALIQSVLGAEFYVLRSLFLIVKNDWSYTWKNENWVWDACRGGIGLVLAGLFYASSMERIGDEAFILSIGFLTFLSNLAECWQLLVKLVYDVNLCIRRLLNEVKTPWSIRSFYKTFSAKSRLQSLPGFQLLAACKQTHREGERLFYQTNTFHLPVGSSEVTLRWLNTLRPEHRDMIESVCIYYTLADLTSPILDSITKLVES